MTVCVKARRGERAPGAVSLSGRASGCDNARVVVQCPSCQSRFRVADEKVTERGVRVRCTVCKNVFPVKKGAPPADGEADAKRPSPGPVSAKQGADAKRLDIHDLF